jgi:hypothetical protein
MDARIRNSLLGLAVLSLGGCATWHEFDWHKLDWRKSKAAPTDVVRASCEASVNAIKDSPDYNTAMAACLDAKTRQHRN